jgi:hypothetical protein
MGDQRDYGDETNEEGMPDFQSLLTEENMTEAEGFLQNGDTNGLMGFAAKKLGSLFGFGGNDQDQDGDQSQDDQYPEDDGN